MISAKRRRFVMAVMKWIKEQGEKERPSKMESQRRYVCFNNQDTDLENEVASNRSVFIILV
jgi:hypothetical protein